MSKQVVNIGSIANDGTGDPLRVAMDKLNDNFNEIYAALGGDTVTNIINDDQEIDVSNRANKIAFLYAAVDDLPNATTYNGSLAVVAETGSVYYAHDDQWNKLLADSSNTTIANYYEALSPVAYSGDLLDLAGISDGSSGQVLSTDGAGNFSFITVSGGSGGNSFTNIVVAGQSNVVAESTSDTLTLVAGSNITLTTNAASDSITISSAGGGGGSSATRQSQTVSTSSIADNATATITFNGLGLSYVLYSIQVDRAAWVRIYTDSTSLSGDSGRSQGSDPAEGSGLIAEVIATGATTFKISPGVFGYIDNGETTISVAVTNLSGATSAVAVTLNVLTLES